MHNGLDRLPRTDPTSLLRYRDGIYAVDLLTAAIVEFRIFTLLRDNRFSFAELCEHYGWAKRPADVLVTLLKANLLVTEEQDGTLKATTLAEEHLCEGSPWDLSGYYESLKDRPVVKDFVKVLATGEPAHWSGHDAAKDDWHGAMMDKDFAAGFTRAMDARGPFLGKHLSDRLTPYLGERCSLLDIGGGSGVYSCALAANNPGLHARVMEQAPVDAIAREKIGERGLGERVGIVTGDMFTDPWPEDCDIHLFSNVMHDWDVPDILKLLARSREAITPRGIVAVHETFLNEEKNGPLPVAEYSCILAHSTNGRCYSVSEMRQYLEEAGFTWLGTHDTGGDRGVIVAEAR